MDAHKVTKYAHITIITCNFWKNMQKGRATMSKKKETMAPAFKSNRSERQYYNRRREMEKRIRHKPVGRREWEEI